MLMNINTKTHNINNTTQPQNKQTHKQNTKTHTIIYMFLYTYNKHAKHRNIQQHTYKTKQTRNNTNATQQ